MSEKKKEEEGYLVGPPSRVFAGEIPQSPEARMVEILPRKTIDTERAKALLFMGRFGHYLSFFIIPLGIFLCALAWYLITTGQVLPLPLMMWLSLIIGVTFMINGLVLMAKC